MWLTERLLQTYYFVIHTSIPGIGSINLVYDEDVKKILK